MTDIGDLENRLSDLDTTIRKGFDGLQETIRNVGLEMSTELAQSIALKEDHPHPLMVAAMILAARIDLPPEAAIERALALERAWNKASTVRLGKKKEDR